MTAPLLARRSAPPFEGQTLVRESLSSRATGRPAAMKTLDSTIDGMFPDGLPPELRAEVIAALQSSRFLAVARTKVTYG